MTTSNTAPLALVIGGTSGLGRASAEALVASGSRIIVTGRDAARAAAIAKEIGRDVTSLPLDLTDPDSLASFCSTAAGLGISQLVLNSGGPKPSTALKVNSAAVREALEFLLFAQVDIVSAVLPGMLEAGWGRIVGIGSSGVQLPIPTLALSNMGRAALAAYLKTLASDVAASGVTVNMVLPGRIDTDRVASLDANAANRSGSTVDAVRAASEAKIPAKRYGRPEEFGNAVAYLCSVGASFITGEQLRVDGAMVGSY
ncbi:MAG: 3-oxoacyl-ACP reductase [Glaciihabitans sp.]|nr:3-oxoacyl-ACP reductase [Glaciihabitans sp.]